MKIFSTQHIFCCNSPHFFIKKNQFAFIHFLFSYKSDSFMDISLNNWSYYISRLSLNIKLTRCPEISIFYTVRKFILSNINYFLRT